MALVVKNLPADAENIRLKFDQSQSLGRAPGGGHGNPLQ